MPHHHHQRSTTTAAILDAKTVVENGSGAAPWGRGYDSEILQEPSAGNAGEQLSVGCGTTNPTGLSPHIQLLNGNVSPETEPGSTAVTTTSVSAADTGQTMRPNGGGYIYNLRVPDGAAGTKYTIRVNPFGATANNAATGMYIVLEIRK